MANESNNGRRPSGSHSIQFQQFISRRLEDVIAPEPWPTGHELHTLEIQAAAVLAQFTSKADNAAFREFLNRSFGERPGGKPVTTRRQFLHAERRLPNSEGAKSDIEATRAYLSAAASAKAVQAGTPTNSRRAAKP